LPHAMAFSSVLTRCSRCSSVASISSRQIAFSSPARASVFRTSSSSRLPPRAPGAGASVAAQGMWSPAATSRSRGALLWKRRRAGEEEEGGVDPRIHGRGLRINAGRIRG
jgi:hypothetical protein